MRYTISKAKLIFPAPKAGFKKKRRLLSLKHKECLIAWKLASCVQGDAFSSASSSKPFKPRFNPQLALLQDRIFCCRFSKWVMFLFQEHFNNRHLTRSHTRYLCFESWNYVCGNYMKLCVLLNPLQLLFLLFPPPRKTNMDPKNWWCLEFGIP